MRIAIVVAALVLSFGLLTGQAQMVTEPAAFYIDFGIFAGENADEDLLEIYYQIYLSRLLFVRAEGDYRANYTVSAVIKEGKKQITGIERDTTIIVESYDRASDPRAFVLNALKFKLRPGRYNIDVTLNDLNASSSIPLQTTVSVPDFDSPKPHISGIEFARKIDTAAVMGVFNKGNYQVIPSCSRRYGDGLMYLKYYFEYYDAGRADSMAQFIYDIKDDRGGVVASATIEHKLEGDRIGIIDSMNLENLKPGQYEFQVSTAAGPKGELVIRSGSFSIRWTALEMVQNDYERAVRQLRYIADSREIESLKNTPKDSRLKEWNDFWKSRDPSPDTDENELMQEYYNRVAFANAHYEIPNKPGWETDMGMIYIINGEPDEIERHPFDMDTKPYEIWYYYNPRRRFLFIDMGGYNDYVLQYPFDGDVNKQINVRGGGP